MRKSQRIIIGLAFACLAAASGSALTGTGLTSNAGATKFIGGTVSQTVTGGTLSSIAYTYLDATNTAIISFVLTFADANTNGMTPTALVTATAADVFTCTVITATISTCTGATPDTGVTGVAITVPTP